jgi:hypothetical protein
MRRRRSDWNNAPSLLTAASVDRPPITLREALGPFRSRFGWTGLYFLFVFLVGMVGYMVIEHWRWFDALYMAVTTVTSVGFMEVRPLTPAGRSFTIDGPGYVVGAYDRSDCGTRSGRCVTETSDHAFDRELEESFHRLWRG